MASRKQIKKNKPRALKKDTRPRVLVLGITGMLGSMMFRYLHEQGFLVAGTVRNKKSIPKKITIPIFELDAEKTVVDERVFKKWKPAFVVNCIGIIKPYCKDDDAPGVLRAIRVNALFPHLLADLSERYGFRVIQIATDCVYSGTKGGYVETDSHDALDVYGKTKSLGEVRRGKFLNIRTSIIGFEEKGKLSLLEWFLAQPKGTTIKGFAHHRWNGVTVLQFATFVGDVITRGLQYFDTLVAGSFVYHFVPNMVVDKYELMLIFNEIFKRDLIVERIDTMGPPVDRTLQTRFTLVPESGKVPMKEAVRALVTYINK